MLQQLAVGDHLRRNSEAAYVSGVIVREHTYDVDDRTDHIALHKGKALTTL